MKLKLSVYRSFHQGSLVGDTHSLLGLLHSLVVIVNCKTSGGLSAALCAMSCVALRHQMNIKRQVSICFGLWQSVPCIVTLSCLCQSNAMLITEHEAVVKRSHKHCRYFPLRSTWRGEEIMKGRSSIFKIPVCVD